MKNIVFSLTLLSVCFLQMQNTAAQSVDFVRDNTWSFDNFQRSDTTIFWDLFRESFIGVAPTPAAASPFEVLLFNELYKKQLFPVGHCFGLDLTALELTRYGGYEGFCAPAFQYPTGAGDSMPADPNLLRLIQKMHSRQLNFRFLYNLLDVLAQGKNRDGVYAFDQFKYYKAKGEFCILSISKAITPADGGHAIIAYDYQDLGATKRIYVYDPNRSYYKTGADGRDYYDNHNNFVEITTSNKKWLFNMAGNDVWTGDPAAGTDSAGGNLIVLPFSVMRTKDRLPQSLFADAAEAVNKVFIFGKGVKINQISTPDGRQMYDAPGSNCLEETMPLRTAMPFIPMNGGKPLDAAVTMWLIKGEKDCTLQITGNQSGYKIQIYTDREIITAQSAIPNATDRIEISGLNSGHAEIIVLDQKGEKSSASVNIEQAGKMNQ